jgi:hypothetical protein
MVEQEEQRDKMAWQLRVGLGWGEIIIIIIFYYY